MRELMIASILLVCAAPAQAEPSEALLSQLRDSMVKVHVDTRGGGRVLGSGVVVSENMVATNCHVLANTGVNVHMISQGASEINISVVVDEADVPRAVKALHGELFTKPLSQRARKSKLPAGTARTSQRETSYKLASLGGAAGDD